MKMTPQEIGTAYDQLVHLWLSENFDHTNGIAQHKLAMSLSKPTSTKPLGLNLGCGCNGRLTELLLSEGFEVEGLDISSKMLQHAIQQFPQIRFYEEDMLSWQPPHLYDFISCWDVLWHVPLQEQVAFLHHVAEWLKPGGVFIVSVGGLEHADEHLDDYMGPTLYYASLGLDGYQKAFAVAGLQIEHFEYDQKPEQHAYFIVKKSDS